MDKEALHTSRAQDLIHSDERTAAIDKSTTDVNEAMTRAAQPHGIVLPAGAERREDIAAALNCFLREQPFPECHQALQMMLAAKVIGLPGMTSEAQSKNLPRLPSHTPTFIPKATHASSSTEALVTPGPVSALELSGKTPAISDELPALSLQNYNANEPTKINASLPLAPEMQNLQQAKRFDEKFARSSSGQQNDANQSEATQEMEHLTLGPQYGDVETLQNDQEGHYGSPLPVLKATYNAVLDTNTMTRAQNNEHMTKNTTHPVTSRYETFLNENRRQSTEDETKPKEASDVSRRPDTETPKESWKTSEHDTVSVRHTTAETLRKERKWTPLVLRPTPTRVMLGSTCIAGLPQHNSNLLSSTLFKNHLLSKKEEVQVVPTIPVHQLHPYYQAPHKYPALHQASFVKLHHHLHYHHHHGSSNNADPSPRAHLYHPQQQHKTGSGFKRRKMTVMSGKERADITYRASAISTAGLDIAACDGPVFFERVLNKAFAGTTVEDVDSDAEIIVDDLDPADAAQERCQQKVVGGLKRQPHRLQQLPATTYHCVYCNHTFKSHYCYQKHMRRHINPITVEVQPRTTAVDASPMEVLGTLQDDTTTNSLPVSGSDITHVVACENTAQKNASADAEGASQSVTAFNSSTDNDGTEDDALRNFVGETHDSPQCREKEFDVIMPVEDPTVLQLAPPNSSPVTASSRPILDLNVQYFPCKTCGSKFPSYYFVHKHRRLCHGEQSCELRDNRVTVVKSKLAAK